MDKKAVLHDIHFVPFILLGIAVISLLTYHILTQVSTSMSDSGEIDSENIAVIDDYSSRIPAIYDQLFVFVMVLLSILVLVSSFMVGSHPVFYFFSAIILGFFAVVNAILSNVWEELVTNTDLSASAEQFSMIPFVMKYFPFFILVLSIIIIIVMAAKRAE